MLVRPAADLRPPRPPSPRVSLDRTKILDQAQKHLQKGALDKAIVEYQKLVKDDPQDVRTWLKIGDLFTRLGSTREAVDTYGRVAETYAQQGFFLKAVAVYKQILKLDPQSIETQLRLAGMYEHLALVSDALATYELVATVFARDGQLERALQTMARMVELDPENISIRIKFAESLSKAGKTPEAAREFEAGAKLLREQGRIDDFIKVGERLLFHRPDDVKLARELATLYLERADAKRALAKLQTCFKANPKDVVTLELLGQAFLGLQQQQKTISVFKEIARIHLDAGRDDERARILHRILELDPTDADARQALTGKATPTAAPARATLDAPPASAVVQPPAGRDAPTPPAATSAPAPTGAVDSVEDIDEDILIEDEGSQASATVDGPRGDAARDAQVARLLNECTVFQRYGLKQKVVEQLEKVIRIDPRHIEARDRLKAAYLEAGRVGDAVLQLRAIVELLLDQHPDHAILALRDLVALAPDDEDARQQLAILTDDEPFGDAPPTSQFVDAEPAADDDTLAAAAQGDAPTAAVDDDGVMFVDDERSDHMVAADAFDDATHAASPLDALVDAHADAPIETVQDTLSAEPATVHEHRLDDDGGEEPRRAPDDADATPVPGALPDESVDAGAAALEAGSLDAGSLDAGSLDAGSLDAGSLEAGAPQSAAPQSAAPQSSTPLTPTPEAWPAPPASASADAPAVVGRSSQRASAAEIEDVLDEVEFYLAQGLVDEARDTLRDTLSSHPGHPLILEKLAELEGDGASGDGSSDDALDDEPAESPPPDDAFLVAERLAAELDGVDEPASAAPVVDVDQVFAQFKKGVEEQIGIEDTDTHFDLGIAYKEMGLLDDAIGEFKLSMSNPVKECLAHTMIGLCLAEKGSLADAISHFKKGLYCDTKSEREELGLYYELGAAYELLHDPKEALYYFQKVQKRDAGFRNVAARIRALAQPRPVPPPPPTKNATDDVDRAFDDLMGDLDDR
jgi:pilus assembly protein FimV